MTISLAVALGGAVIRLACYAGAGGNFFSLAFGQALIGLANVRMLVEAFTHASNLSRQWAKSMLASSLPGGYLLAQLTYQIIFTREDAYIDKIPTALWKIETYMGVQAFLILPIFIAHLCLKRKWSYSLETDNETFREFLAVILKRKRSLIILTFAIGLYLQAFYLQVLKWPHLTNQFNFTQVIPN